MVSLFILALSLVASGCFALGGYWNCLCGALLGVWTSILDGCDGEVARLKLQVSDFGCWLDTICDYLYYFVTFAGITIGLVRSKGEPSLAGWCVAVFAGAIMTFIMAGIGRKRLVRRSARTVSQPSGKECGEALGGPACQDSAVIQSSSSAAAFCPICSWCSQC